MDSDYEAIKAGTKEAVAEWLETAQGREAITAGARAAIVDWIELTALGTFAVSDGAKAAVTAWLDGNEDVVAHAIERAQK